MNDISCKITGINKKIWKIWEKFYGENRLVERLPLFYPNNLKTNGLLIIGANPSFNKNAIKDLCNQFESEDDVETFFSFTQIKEKSFDDVSNIIKKCIKIDNKAKLRYSYYQKMDEIAKQINLEFEHIDTFLVRETSQSTVKAVLQRKDIKTYNNASNKKRNEFFTDFAKSQLCIYKEMIKLISPKIILVANAWASQIFALEFEVNFEDDKDKGYWTSESFKINGNKIPIFLSGMLSGQRALDIFSYKRLKWHICKTYNSQC